MLFRSKFIRRLIKYVKYISRTAGFSPKDNDFLEYFYLIGKFMHQLGEFHVYLILKFRANLERTKYLFFLLLFLLFL